MSKKPFQVGDRVRVYGTTWKFKPVQKEAKILEIRNGCLILHGNDLYHHFDTGEDGWDITIVHPKQCRRLKPKKKPEAVKAERMERWYWKGGCEHFYQTAKPFGENTDPNEIIHLVELRPGEMIVNELMLGTAMDDCGDTVFNGVGNALMEMLCKHLSKYQKEWIGLKETP